jgi:hypothetical protein
VTQGFAVSPSVGVVHLSDEASAAVLRDSNIAVNCYRIGIQVASEGYVMNAPDTDPATRWLRPASGVGVGVLLILID